jgi:hypothetical protein
MMSGMVQLKVRPEHLKGAINGSERRRYKRFEVTLLGRYLRVLTKQEFTCRLMDISVGGASLMCDTPPQIGEMVVVQFEEIGGLEGTVARAVPGGFAVQFSATHRRRQKLAAQITWLLNRHELAAADQRRPGHDRIALSPKPARLELQDGKALECNVIDVSISGASVEMAERPPIGSTLVLGRYPVKVVRHHSRGIGVEFSYVQQFETIQEDFG